MLIYTIPTSTEDFMVPGALSIILHQTLLLLPPHRFFTVFLGTVAETIVTKSFLCIYTTFSTFNIIHLAAYFISSIEEQFNEYLHEEQWLVAQYQLQKA